MKCNLSSSALAHSCACVVHSFACAVFRGGVVRACVFFFACPSVLVLLVVIDVAVVIVLCIRHSETHNRPH